MRWTAWLLFVPAILAVACGIAQSANRQELSGEYKWSHGAEGKLTARFTETGEDSWDVDFHFKFDGVRHVYSGTAEGNLTDGELSGTVHDEGNGRRFAFKGTFQENGEFHGTHAETTPGRNRDTGTLTLTR